MEPAPVDAATAHGDVIDRFHYLYYHAAEQTWQQTRWLGLHVHKCPLDLWIYQEILFELRPDVIIESGTYRGGSALFLAAICDLLDHGRVYSIDVDRQPGAPAHPRIEYLDGSSTSETTLQMVRERVRPGERALVILDSDHSAPHVRHELECYAPFVPPGGYLILEDTNINGHPVLPGFGPGPMEALIDFLAAHPEFESDLAREKLLLSFNPRGYLRRAGPAWTTEADQEERTGRAATATLGPELTAARERIAGQQRDIAAHRDQIGVLRDYIEAHERDVARYIESLVDAVRRHEGDQRASHAATAEGQAREAAAAERAQALNADVQKLTADVRRLDAQVRGLERDLQARDAEIAGLRNSRLWRLGAPYRALRAKMRI